MAKFHSRTEKYVFYVSLVIAVLLTINGLRTGFFSSYSYLVNPEGLVSYSDNFEKGILDPAYINGGAKVVLSTEIGMNPFSSAITECSDDPSRIIPPCSDVDGKPYFLRGSAGNEETEVFLTQDLKGKAVQFDYLAYLTNAQADGIPNLAWSNCGEKAIQDSAFGQVRVASSKIDDSKYVFLVNGQFVCKGELRPGEKLSMGVKVHNRGGQVNLASWGFKWVFPFQCRAEEGMDLAFEDFSSGETITLTGSTQRWPKALCPELAPVLINQSAKGITRLEELLPLLASPPKGSKPYVVPNTCNADNTGGCVLRLAYWIRKDPSVPTACVDNALQRAFNLDERKCDDIINIRNFCTEGIIYNNECLTPTDVKTKFNCEGTLDLNAEIPVCYESRTRTGVLAFCKPSQGGIDPITGKCPDEKDPYTTFEAACKADGGVPEGERCLKDIGITFQDPKTGQPVATAPYNPTTGFGNYQFSPGIPATVQDSIKKKCEDVNSKGECVTSTSEKDLVPWYERVFGLNKVFFGFRLKFWVLLLSVLTVLYIGLWPRKALFR